MGTNKRYYRGKAKEWALGETSKGAPQVAVLLEVTTPDAAEKHLTWYGYFSDATADRTLESLRLMGWKGDDLNQLDGLGDNEVELVVEDEEYEGKTRAKVQWINRPASLQLKASMAPDKAKAFAASMRDRIRALDASNGQRRPPAPPKPPAGDRPASAVAEEDLPF